MMWVFLVVLWLELFACFGHETLPIGCFEVVLLHLPLCVSTESITRRCMEEFYEICQEKGKRLFGGYCMEFSCPYCIIKSMYGIRT